jgi:hypothetical protein
MNIVEMIQQSIRGETSSKLGRLIGEDDQKTRTAATAAVPALLASLAHLSSSDQGARRLDDAVDKADDSTSGLGHMLTSQGGSLLDSGRSMLTSLLGHDTLTSLAGGLGKFTGLGSGSTLGLLGGLVPFVMGTLKRARGTMGAEAGGIGDLLASQKQNIASAMPSGLSGLLSHVPGMDQFTAPVKAAAQSASAAGGRAMSMAGEYGERAVSAGREYGERAASGGSHFLRWAIPLVALALIGWAIYYFTQQRSPTMPTLPSASAPPTTQPGEAVPASVRLGGTANQAASVTDNLKNIVASATDSLSKVSDPQSADAAIPSLRDLGTKLDGLKTSVDALPATARGTVAPMLNSVLPGLQDAAHKAMSQPGVGDKLQPVVQPILDKLDAIAGNPPH